MIRRSFLPLVISVAVAASGAVIVDGIANAPSAGAAIIECDGSFRTNSGPEWSPDGSRLAWTGADDDGEIRVWVAASDGTGRREISTVAAGPDPRSNTGPVWSPDGGRIAWSGHQPGATSHIWVAAADGTGRIEISTVAPESDPTNNFSPAWSPDGDRIAWSGAGGAGAQIWVANADGTDRTEVSIVAVGPDPTANRAPVWSPDGASLAWSGEDASGVRRIWVADADGTNRIVVSSVASGRDPVRNESPRWSPNGARLAWSGAIGGGEPQIFVADADGTDRSEISSGSESHSPAAAYTPAWSSNSRRLAWAGPSRDDPDTHIWVADADGDGAKRVSTVGGGTDPTGNLTPRWAPDGPRITWSGRDGFSSTGIPHREPSGLYATQIWVSAANGTNRRAVTSTFDFPMPFSDVPETSFAHGDVACLYALGVTTGVGPTTYDPGGPVTREQMASFLARLWRSGGGTCPTGGDPFTDVSSSSFARGDITCIYALGITTGTGSTTFDPGGLVTREQMASFLARLWRLPRRICPVPDPFGLPRDPFTDVEPTSFARDDIACIYQLRVTTGTGPRTYDPAAAVTREQMAAFIARLVRTG